MTGPVSQWRNIEGRGAVCFEADGSVRLFVSDEVAELVAAAERAGMSADQLVNKILDEAEGQAARLSLADGTGPVTRQVSQPWVPDYS